MTSDRPASLLEDTRIARVHPLVSPAVLAEELPLSEADRETVAAGRDAVRRIVHGEDDRWLAVVGTSRSRARWSAGRA
jgi:3-deoxy-7-phosphoheptulonate synthase